MFWQHCFSNLLVTSMTNPVGATLCGILSFKENSKWSPSESRLQKANKTLYNPQHQVQSNYAI